MDDSSGAGIVEPGDFPGSSGRATPPEVMIGSALRLATQEFTLSRHGPEADARSPVPARPDDSCIHDYHATH
jgi:hypothetical protein